MKVIGKLRISEPFNQIRRKSSISSLAIISLLEFHPVLACEWIVDAKNSRTAEVNRYKPAVRDEKFRRVKLPSASTEIRCGYAMYDMRKDKYMVYHRESYLAEKVELRCTSDSESSYQTSAFYAHLKNGNEKSIPAEMQIVADNEEFVLISECVQH